MDLKEDKLIEISEVLKILSISRQTLYRWIGEGLFPQSLTGKKQKKAMVLLGSARLYKKHEKRNLKHHTLIAIRVMRSIGGTR